MSPVNKSLPLSSFELVYDIHPFQPHKDLAPKAPIQLLLLLINKIDLMAKVERKRAITKCSYQGGVHKARFDSNYINFLL